MHAHASTFENLHLSNTMLSWGEERGNVYANQHPEDCKSNGDDNTFFGRIQQENCHKDPAELVHNDEDQVSAQDKSDQGSSEDRVSPKKVDLFTRYSNNNVRMWHLLGLDDEEEFDIEHNTGWKQLTGYQDYFPLNEGDNGNTPRKTILSTELHPDVFLDLLLGDED